MKKFLIGLMVAILAMTTFVMFGCKSEKKSVNELGIVEIEAPKMVELDTWGVFTSGMPNNIIKVKSSNENAVFVCTTEKGMFWDMHHEFRKQVIIASGEWTWWRCTAENEGIPEKNVIDIVVQEGDNITGYAVIYIVQIEGYSYSATVVKSVLFPKVDGESQIVTREQVAELIENIKNSL